MLALPIQSFRYTNSLADSGGPSTNSGLSSSVPGSCACYHRVYSDTLLARSAPAIAAYTYPFKDRSPATKQLGPPALRATSLDSRASCARGTTPARASRPTSCARS
ncbi:hypothetical protein AcV7_001443 [Taiwanofungus camphoratus]|nr:hypothetical protein AcV7_001443 [Antrodia cinnamomea]